MDDDVLRERGGLGGLSKSNWSLERQLIGRIQGRKVARKSVDRNSFSSSEFKVVRKRLIAWVNVNDSTEISIASDRFTSLTEFLADSVNN